MYNLLARDKAKGCNGVNIRISVRTLHTSVFAGGIFVL